MKILKLIIAWTWVALPLGWGVYQSVQKSLPLFQESTQSGGFEPRRTGDDVEPGVR